MSSKSSVLSFGSCWSEDLRLEDLVASSAASSSVSPPPRVACATPATLRFSPLVEPPTRPPALRPPEAWLILGDTEGAERLAFPAAGLTLGRSGTCGVTLDDTALSWQEAEIIWDGRDFRLRGLGRAQGYRVNGHALGETVLRHGDWLEFGRLTFRWCCPENLRSVRALRATRPAWAVDMARWEEEALLGD